MKKTMCLITILFAALFFSGCASTQGVWDKILGCEDAPVPVDTDGDGVVDCKDKCPNTPKGVAVDPDGCPLDTDGDGVYDYLDKCPRTPKGAKVNTSGCWILTGVNFDTDKSDISIVYSPKLDEVAVVLTKNPGVKVEVQGHTDNIASAKYNQKLSERRAAAVKEYLVGKGIAAERMIEKGFGLTAPIATNDTEEGRAQNRRVQLKAIK